MLYTLTKNIAYENIYDNYFCKQYVVDVQFLEMSPLPRSTGRGFNPEFRALFSEKFIIAIRSFQSVLS